MNSMDNILIQSYKNLLYYDPTSNKMFHNLNKVLQTSNQMLLILV